MPTKSVKLAVLTTGVDDAISKLSMLSDTKNKVGGETNVVLHLDGADLTEDKLDVLSAQIRDLSDKGANIRVRLDGVAESSAEMDAFSDSANDLSASGAKVTGTLRDAGKESESFGAKLKNAFSGAFSTGTLLAVGAAIGLSVDVAFKAQEAQAQLKSAVQDAGGSWAKYAGSVDSAESSMAKFGYTDSQVDQALTSLIRATGSVTVAEGAMTTAANLAASKHIDLASATSMLARAAGGAMRGLKDLGITQITGANTAKAMASAQTALQDQISSAGSMAQFAAAHHISLAQAEKLVAAASGQASQAVNELAHYGLTATSATTLLTEAQNGDSTATAKLATLHLSLAQLQDLVTKSTHGSIEAYNQLGIVVLPKTATAAQRLAEIEAVMNERLGGSAAAQAATFAGKLDAVKAEFEDMAERIGMAVLPALGDVIGVFVKLGACRPAIDVIMTGMVLLTGAIIGAKVAALLAIDSTEGALISSGIGALLVAVGIAIMELIQHWHGLETGVKDVWHGIEDASSAAWNWLKNNWATLLAAMFALETAGLSLVALDIYKHWHDIEHYTDDLRSYVISAWDGMTSGISDFWNLSWNNTIGRLENGITDAHNLINTFVGWIWNRFSSAGSWLVSAGRDLIQGLYNGALDLIGDVGSWAAHIGSDIVNAVKNFFGIHSPSTVFAGIGGNLMLGLIEGMISHNPVTFITKILGGMPSALIDIIGKGFIGLGSLPEKVLSDIMGLGGKLLGGITGFAKGIWDSLFGGGGGGDVAAYASAIMMALQLLGQPSSLLGDVEHRMNQESGGNPDAVNRWDSNWKAGHPSVGLMQVIGPTFAEYAGPFRNVGPFAYGVSENPLANIFAGLNYALHAYGDIAGPMMQAGGYATGGWITEPMFAMGASGNGLWLGENGPELVVPAGAIGAAGGGSGDTYYIQIGVATDPNATAQAIWQMLRRFKQKKGGMPLGLD